MAGGGRGGGYLLWHNERVSTYWGSEKKSKKQPKEEKPTFELHDEGKNEGTKKRTVSKIPIPQSRGATAPK